MGNCCEQQSKDRNNMVNDYQNKKKNSITHYDEKRVDRSFQQSSSNQNEEGKDNYLIAEQNEIMKAKQIFINRQNGENGQNNNNKIVSITDFTLLKVIGKGSFGKVILSQKKNSGKLFAIKILKKDLIERRNQKLHTKAERDILELINCPFIVQLYYAFQTSEKLYMVMEFMQGGELFYHLRKSYRFDQKKTQFYAAEIVLALEHLHSQNIIYRDLKPENVLLDEEGHIKIADFGLSKQGISDGNKAYTFCGTPEYLAPEILEGVGHDKAVDWWSLGALIYEMLTGTPPFYSRDRYQMFKNILEKPLEIKSYFSPEAVSLLQGLLNIDPKRRLGSSPDDSLEIKQHLFFHEIDWDRLKSKDIQPPFKPRIQSTDDVTNFDKMFTEEKNLDTPVLNEFFMNEKNNSYAGFTYINKNIHSKDDKILEEDHLIDNN